MPYVINIINMKTNSIAQNGNIDFGPTIQNSHTANSKWLGINLAMGDFSVAASGSLNTMADPDISDQGQIANPSPAALNPI